MVTISPIPCLCSCCSYNIDTSGKKFPKIGNVDNLRSIETLSQSSLNDVDVDVDVDKEEKVFDHEDVNTVFVADEHAWLVSLNLWLKRGSS